MRSDEFINKIRLEVESLELNSLDRKAVPIGGFSNFIDFTSNDYLGLGSKVESKPFRCDGSGASRVLSGTTDSHVLLENELALFFREETALFFGSGYLANIGVLSSLVGRNDTVLADKYIHRSLIDGIRLSGAKLFRAKHNDLNSYETFLKQLNTDRKRGAGLFIVVESIYSMDGDFANLGDLANLARRYDALLIVDDAHAIGLYNQGRGLVPSSLSDVVIARLGTASKALGAYGGFFLGRKEVRDYLINKAGSFIYSTSLPEANCLTLIDRINFIRENSDLGLKTLENAKFFKEQLLLAGVDKATLLDSGTTSQIIPFVLGGNHKLIELKEALLKEGVLVAAIRPPTVPRGTSRIRFSIRANHLRDELRQTAILLGDLLNTNKNLMMNI